VEQWEDKKGMETILPHKNKLIQDSEGNKKTDIQFQTPTNKGKLCQQTQQSPEEHTEEEILKVINENFIEMLLDMVNQNI
jgi:hypothetical protein